MSLLMSVLSATVTFLISGVPQPPKIRTPVLDAKPAPLYWFPLTVLCTISA